VTDDSDDIRVFRAGLHISGCCMSSDLLAPYIARRIGVYHGNVHVKTSQYGPARPVGPDGCGPVTSTGNRDNKEILAMSGPMSERAPDITVEADGRAESTTVLVAKVSIMINNCFRKLRRPAAHPSHPT
jgi:hypothetical protein